MSRLAMSLVVRDEVELISANIAFHAAQGVDAFFIMDNGSVDGTRERLNELKQAYDLVVVDQPDKSFKQGEWATELALIAREIGKADYIISNDADEFWASTTGSIKHQCTAQTLVVSAARTNMLPLVETIAQPDYPFYRSVFNVHSPLKDVKPTTDPRASVPIMLRAMPRKVMCSLKGLKRIRLGNHTVEHEAGRPAEISDVHIYHFPVRPFDQFTKRIEFAKEQFAHEAPSKRKGNFCWHKRRWVAQMELSLLRDEWESFALRREEACELEDRGVVMKPCGSSLYLEMRPARRIWPTIKTHRAKAKRDSFIEHLWRRPTIDEIFIGHLRTLRMPGAIAADVRWVISGHRDGRETGPL